MNIPPRVQRWIDQAEALGLQVTFKEGGGIEIENTDIPRGQLLWIHTSGGMVGLTRYDRLVSQSYHLRQRSMAWEIKKLKEGIR